MSSKRYSEIKDLLVRAGILLIMIGLLAIALTEQFIAAGFLGASLLISGAMSYCTRFIIEAIGERRD